MKDSHDSHLTLEDFDDLLSDRLADRLVSHLETCVECRRQGAFQRRMDHALATLAPVPTPDLSDRIMASVRRAHPELEHSVPHFTADDLDAWLLGTLGPARLWHLADCAACQQLADTERQLVAALAALPLYSPSVQFTDRVLAAIGLPEPTLVARPWRDRVLASRRSLAVAATLATLVVGSMSVSVVWSVGHRETILAAGRWLGDQGTQWLWMGLRSVASALMAQPWYTELQDLLAAPGRIATVSALVLGAYLTGVLALRRLIALPISQAARAG